MWRAGWTARYEPTRSLEGSHDRPDIAISPGPLGTVNTFIDVMVTATWAYNKALSNPALYLKDINKRLRYCADLKMRKYAARYAAAGCNFLPVVFDVHGGLYTQSPTQGRVDVSKLFSSLARDLAKAEGVSNSTATAHIHASLAQIVAINGRLPG